MALCWLVSEPVHNLSEIRTVGLASALAASSLCPGPSSDLEFVCIQILIVAGFMSKFTG